MGRFCLLAVVLAASGAAQDWEAQVRALRPADVSAQENAVLDNLENRAKAALGAITHARDRYQADRQRGDLRRRLAHSLGYFELPWPPKLNAKVVGVVKRDGYRIERVVYQSLPGVKVPAHLYLPDGARGRGPAVLFYPGHWWTDSKTRPDFQAFCINMAKLGFVVMAFDTFGQGERGVSWRDHRRTEALLMGVSQQGFAEYETQCAFRYLVSRREVDRRRLGITGASGGGYNTWITSALEERIQVAVPVVGTSDFYEQIHVTRPLDWYHASEHCHFVPGLLRYANNHELAAMVAPRPLLIIAASEDQSFPIEGVRKVAEYAASIYESYGERKKFGFFEDISSGHGYQQKKREAAYGWFLRWLKGKGDGRPYAEPPTEIPGYDSPELRCFAAGENQPSGPGMIEMARRMAKHLPPASARPHLDTFFGETPEMPLGRVQIKDAPLQRLLIPSGPGLETPAFLARPAGPAKGVLLAADDRGKEAIAADPLFRHALEEGWAVCGVDPRGIGEMATSKMGWVSAVSLLLGENFVARQARDLNQTLKYLGSAKEFAGKPVGLYARGDNSSLAVTYLLAREAYGTMAPIAWYVLRDGFVSYRQFFERSKSLELSYKLQPDAKERFTVYGGEIPFQYFPFHVLKSFDLPQLLAHAQAKGLIVNPINGDWERMPEAEARKLAPAGVSVVVGPEPEKAIQEFVAAVGGFRAATHGWANSLVFGTRSE